VKRATEQTVVQNLQRVNLANKVYPAKPSQSQAEPPKQPTHPLDLVVSNFCCY